MSLNLPIQVGFQQGNDGSGNLLGALFYTAVGIFGQPQDLFTYVYGGSDNPSATPYPVFVSDATARAYYDAIIGPSYITVANSHTTAGQYSTYSVEPGSIMQVQSSWDETNSSAPDYILGKPSLSAVAISGAYSDLSGTPSIPAAQINSDWNAGSGIAQILNKPSLATVAISGSYTDLTSKPSIPASQVNSDWTANSGLAQILNKPSLATVATTGAYTDLTGKPSIPTVKAYDGTTQRTNAFAVFLSGTVSSGTVVFNITSDGTGTGSALFTNGPIMSSVNFIVNSSTSVFPGSWAWSNSNKTLTLTLGQASATGVISLLGLSLLGAPTTAANGTAVQLSVWGY